jgi:hypothetical protein
MNTELDLESLSTIVPFAPPNGVQVTEGTPLGTRPVSTRTSRVRSLAACWGLDVIL